MMMSFENTEVLEPPRCTSSPMSDSGSETSSSGIPAYYTSVIKVKGMESNITLWQFLLELLLGNQHGDIIQWTNSDGEFKLLNSERVAQLWGLRKNKHNMNYDKLSRALRYYYDKNIIKKVMGQKFVYRFVSFPEIVKTENKIPFREKIQTLAHEYGSCPPPPPFSAYKSPLDGVAPPVSTHGHHWGLYVPPPTTAAEPLDRKPVLVPSSAAGRSEIPQSVVDIGSVHGSLTLPSLSTAPRTYPSAAAAAYTSSSSSSSRHKPQPISLLTPTLAPTVSLPVPSPGPLFAHAGYPRSPAPLSSLQTPQLLLSSPMMGGGGAPGHHTPFVPLHFWSSLSPMGGATLSPHYGSAASHFQFPGGYLGGHLTLSPISLDALNTPMFAISSPSKTIPVP